ncbi:hypothetical protein JHD50_13020 [Sulfurimonas sp. MAG313]|nr:hypothetical protein [Sulfurimonas sp. MAG313]MDF1882210.1 hypothetical protein [Sulfurimonas sp. MAG313]
MNNNFSKKLASFSFLFLAIAFISLTFFNTYEPTRHLTTTLFLVLTVVLYYPLRLIITNKKLSMTYSALIKDPDASSLIMFYIKLPVFLVGAPILLGAFVLLFIKASVFFSINARLIILSIGAFVSIFIFWTFLGQKLIESRDSIALLYFKNRLDQKLGYHVLLFMTFFSVTTDLVESLTITLLFSFLIFDVLFSLHGKTNLRRLFVEHGLFLVFKFSLMSLVVLLSFKYARPILDEVIIDFVLWVNPSLSVVAVYLFLYAISGVGNYVQLNLLISYIFKKPGTQFIVVWTMMAVLYMGLTAIHLRYDHFNKMKKKIEKYQEKTRG